MKHNERYIWLDFIRGLSALAVCGGHLRGAMFVDFSQSDAPNILEKCFYLFTSMGYQAVLIFFVLSGFFVGGSILKNKKNFSFSKYLIVRISRLWTVLIPALIFTFFIDTLLKHLDYNLVSGAYYDQLCSGPNQNYSLSLTTFLGNITFLHTLFFPIFGSNGPLWSLTNEFWYYLLFPIALLALGEVPTSKVKRFFWGGVFILLCIFVAKSLMIGFIIWLLGVGVYFLYQYSFFTQRRVWLTALSALFLIGILLYNRLGFNISWIGIPNDLIVGVFFTIFMSTLHGLNLTSGRWRVFCFISKWISEISYSLYLFHFPIVLLIYLGFYSDRQISFSSLGLLEYLGWLGLIMAVSFIFWYLFERNTIHVRRVLLSLKDKISKK